MMPAERVEGTKGNFERNHVDRLCTCIGLWASGLLHPPGRVGRARPTLRHFYRVATAPRLLPAVRVSQQVARPSGLLVGGGGGLLLAGGRRLRAAASDARLAGSRGARWLRAFCIR
jgi:hypothetical protein